MPNYIIGSDGELYHHGVKGMKWGVRRYTNKDGSLNAAGKKRYNSAGDVKSAKAAVKSAGNAYSKAYSKAHNKAAAAYSPFKKHRQANDERWREAADKADDLVKAKSALKDAKFKQKVDKMNATRSAVKDYKKKFDEAERSSNIADKKWNEVSEQYKSLGRNRIERMMRAAKNDTAAAKAYSKSFDEASRLSDFADTKWNETKEAYRKTGRSRVTRILNNARY